MVFFCHLNFECCVRPFEVKEVEGSQDRRPFEHPEGLHGGVQRLFPQVPTPNASFVGPVSNFTYELTHGTINWI